MFRYLAFAVALSVTVTVPVAAQDNQDKNFDLRSSVGDVHVGSDADARKMGLPLYPGARVSSDHKDSEDHDSDQANLSILTEAFGFKLLVAKYESDDAAPKIVDFYRDKLQKYGKVLECHTKKHGGNVDVHEGKDDKDKDKDHHGALKCEDDSGPVTVLKVGTEDDQHVVAIEPRDSGKGATFAMVYVHARGKRGEI